MSQRTEICKTRTDSGLSCNGCQYRDDCEKIKPDRTAFADEVMPDDIDPDKKQGKVYLMLKKGMSAKEVIAQSGFASETVYRVARQYFPDAIQKLTDHRERKKDPIREDEQMQKALQIVKEAYKKEEPAPKTDETKERIMKLEKIIKDARSWMVQRGEIRGELKYALEKLKDGEFVKCYDAIKKALDIAWQPLPEPYKAESENEECL